MKRFALIALLVVGCGQPPGKLPEQAVLDKEKLEQDAKAGESRQLESEGGEITIYNDKVKTKPEWMVRWKNAQLDYDPGGSKFGGKLGLVEGVIYQNGKSASQFKAKEAFTKPGSRVLQLIGGVEIISAGQGQPNGKVFCQEAIYDADTTKIVAKGPLRVEFMGYLMTGLEEVWAWRDLSLVATPDQWEN